MIRLAHMAYRVTSDNGGGVTVPSVHSDFCRCRHLPLSVSVASRSAWSETGRDRPSRLSTKSVFSWTDCRLTVLLSSRALPAKVPGSGNPGISANDWTEPVALLVANSACSKDANTDLLNISSFHN